MNICGIDFPDLTQDIYNKCKSKGDDVTLYWILAKESDGFIKRELKGIIGEIKKVKELLLPAEIYSDNNEKNKNYLLLNISSCLSDNIDKFFNFPEQRKVWLRIEANKKALEFEGHTTSKYFDEQ